MRRLEHGVGLAHARRIAKEDFQFSALLRKRLLLPLDLPEQRIRIGSAVHA